MIAPNKQQTETEEELVFELPQEVKDALEAARDRLREYLATARDSFEEAEGEAWENADDITGWFDELHELADNLETAPEKPSDD